jgi:hypothetical protein
MGDIFDQQVACNIISPFLEVKFSGSGVAMGYHIFSPKMILQVIVESGVKHHQTNKQTENCINI